VDFFLPMDRAAYISRLNLESEIRESVLDNFRGFEVFYQPIISLAQSMVIGCEALLRWRGTNNGIVAPAVVIPALINVGMFAEVETWVFKTATAQCAEWIEMTKFDNFIMNINMSVKRVAKPGLVEELKEVVASTGVSMSNLFIELTEESFVMQNQSSMVALRNLDGAGFLLAIDDFGTGYSSLGYLRNLPICGLKIDRAFVRDIETSESSREFIGAIIELGHIMNYNVCVEGVETLEQARILTELNADTLQGYYFSPPLRTDLMEKRFLEGITGQEKFSAMFDDLRGHRMETGGIKQKILESVDGG